MFRVYAYNNGQASEAYTEREGQVADGVNTWWIVKIGNHASRRWDSGSIMEFLKLP